MNFPMNYKLGFLIVTIIAIYYAVFIRPFLYKKNLLSKEMQELIDQACERGIAYAEQIYKSDSSIDRMEIAVYFTFYILRKSKAVPESTLRLINGVIEDKVRQLLKSQDNTVI